MPFNFRKFSLLAIGIMAVLLLTGAEIFSPTGGIEPAGQLQEANCLPILLEAAQKAGIPGTLTRQSGNEGSFPEDDIYCYVRYDQERDGGTYSTGLSIRAYPPTNGICATVEKNTTFHGFDARTEQYTDHSDSYTEDQGLIFYNEGFWYLNWTVEQGGYCHIFSVDNSTKFYQGSFLDEPDNENVVMPDVDPVVYGEALWSVAEGYLPLFETLTNNEDPSTPYSEDPDSEDPYTGDDSTTPFYGNDSNAGTNDNHLPVLVVAGSIGVPVIGAITGTILSMLLAGVGTKTPVPTKKPHFGAQNEEGLVWSPRPWDEAGPGFVPKEEYLRTKDFLDKGYKWTSQGWKTPDEIDEYARWQEQDKAAVSREDAEWREEWEQERHELTQKREALAEKGRQLDFAGNFTNLQSDLEDIYQGLKQENIYVANPYQGDPTMVVYGLNTLKNVVWDKTAGVLTGDHGLTCEGFVEKTKDQLLQAVTERFPGSTVQNMIFEEKSTVKPDKSVLDWFDSLVDDNHNLVKVTLPDGSEWAVDFHQYEAGNAPLMRPWAEAQRDWGERYMGSEFSERVRRSTIAEPKPGK